MLDEALVHTSQNLETIKYREMPAFGVLENIVEEEVSKINPELTHTCPLVRKLGGEKLL